MMDQRFWRPEGDHTDAELYPVGAVSSGRRLYVVMEGQAPPPPTKHATETPSVFMMALQIVMASGEELTASGSGSFGKTGPLTYLWQTPLPQDLSGPLTVRLLREDGSVVYEAHMVPVQP